MPSTLRLHRAGAIVRIELLPAGDFPRLSAAVLAELKAALSSLFRDAACTGIVIHGNDQAFAVGAEIAEVTALTPLTALPFARRGQQFFDSLAASAKPVVAAIHGYCLGGGFDLALACHRRLASPAAVFGHPGTSLGLLTGWGGTQRLPGLLGRSRALELLLSSDRITAAQAHTIGLVDLVVPAEQLLPAAIEEARRLSSSPTPLTADALLD